MTKSNKPQKDFSRHVVRLCKLLSKNTAEGYAFLPGDESFMVRANSREHKFDISVFNFLQERNLVTSYGKRLKITRSGISWLNARINPVTSGGPKQETKTVTVKLGCQEQPANLNIDESPLYRLYARKTKAGTSYISQEEFQAGEKLRKDFERGQLQPKISANWGSSVGGTGKHGQQDTSDIADFALDARNRVNKAIIALGPELSGVTVDICCFLKGMELVERERHWPPRSAKLMLKTALSLLARHYGLSGHANTNAGNLRTWGTSDYRPSIG